MKNLVFKELRDVIRWTPLGMLVAIVMVWMALPTEVYGAVRMEDTLIGSLGTAAGLIAIALGALQSFFDVRNDSRAFLLHRPWTQSQIFWAKVIAGFVAYGITLAPAILLGAVYLEWKGIERLPTSAWQVLPFCVFAPAIFLLHPTVVWIANRDARWLRTRLLPAPAVVFGVMLLWAGAKTLDNGQAAIGLTILGVTLTILVPAVLLGSRHAFANESHLPPSSSYRHRSPWSMLMLTISSVVLLGVGGVFLLGALQTHPGILTSYSVILDDEGQWAEMRSVRSRRDWNNVTRSTRPVTGSEAFDPMPKEKLNRQGQFGWALSPAGDFAASTFVNRFIYLGSFQSDSFGGGQLAVVRDGSRLLAYGMDGLAAVITPDGVFRDPKAATGRFAGPATGPLAMVSLDRNFTSNESPIVYDNEGLYQIDLTEMTTRRLLAGSFDQVGLALGDSAEEAIIWTISGAKMTRHQLLLLSEVPGQAGNKEVTMPVLNEKLLVTQVISLPPVKLESKETFEVDPVTWRESVWVVSSADGEFGLVRRVLAREARFGMLDAARKGELESISLTPSTTGTSVETFATVMPPVLMGSVFAAMVLTGDNSGEIRSWTLAIGLLVVHSVISVLFVWWLTGTRGLTLQQRVVWITTATLLGLGTVMAVLAVYPKLVKESCTRCGKERRVDLDDCEHCNRPWDAPPSEGIEILEGELAEGRELAQMA